MPSLATPAATLTRLLLSAVVSDVPCIPELAGEQGGAGSRDSMPGTLFGVEARDVFEADTAVAETY